MKKEYRKPQIETDSLEQTSLACQVNIPITDECAFPVNPWANQCVDNLSKDGTWIEEINCAGNNFDDNDCLIAANFS